MRSGSVGDGAVRYCLRWSRVKAGICMKILHREEKREEIYDTVVFRIRKMHLRASGGDDNDKK